MIELIVSIFIFSIVMTISIGALVQSLDANRKTQSLETVLNNLNVVLDTMTKNIAVGTHYECGTLTTMPPKPQDCIIEAGGGKEISFLFNEDLDGDGLANDVITYTHETDHFGGYISRTITFGQSLKTEGPVRMTAPDVNITQMQFYVTGSETDANGDYVQPKVQIFVKGTAPVGPRNQPTEFKVQTLVSQRIPDFQ